jgi:hypothetical protein
MIDFIDTLLSIVRVRMFVHVHNILFEFQSIIICFTFFKKSFFNIFLEAYYNKKKTSLRDLSIISLIYITNSFLILTYQLSCLYFRLAFVILIKRGNV